MPFFGEIALDTYFDDFAPGSAEKDEENPTFIHLLAFFRVLETRLAALSSAADQAPVHQQIQDYQLPMQRYLGLFSWAVEAKIMDSFVQSVEAIIDSQMNRLYDAVVAFIKLFPSTKKRDLDLYSEYLARFIESQLIANMRTCWNLPNIRTLSDDLIREADRTVVHHGIFRHKRKGFGASLAADKKLKTQFQTTVSTNCLEVFHQQHFATLINRADAVIQRYDKFLLKQC
ncbi:hypothetical protein H4R35_004057 [Dimargaris xerosporica]|nr:hypothetical protein H4R35_004057 [Dimargaris xerosporica]